MKVMSNAVGSDRIQRITGTDTIVMVRRCRQLHVRPTYPVNTCFGIGALAFDGG
jgi:hypothetical protein